MSIKSTILNTSNSLAFLPVRLAVGAVMIGHGAQKLFGWWGGHGLQGTASFFGEHLGLEPGIFMAILAGSAEFFGGILLILGLLTRPAAALIAFTMAVGIIKVHSDAFFLANNGMEFALTLLLASLTLVIGGAGALSVDRKLAAK